MSQSNVHNKSTKSIMSHFQKSVISTNHKSTSLKVICHADIWYFICLRSQSFNMDVECVFFPVFPGLRALCAVDLHLDSVFRWVTLQEKHTFTILWSADIFDIWGFSKKTSFDVFLEQETPVNPLNHTPRSVSDSL